MRPEIPSEQLDRIRPVVDALLEQLDQLAKRLPLEAESAVTFQTEEENAE